MKWLLIAALALMVVTSELGTAPFPPLEQTLLPSVQGESGPADSADDEDAGRGDQGGEAVTLTDAWERHPSPPAAPLATSAPVAVLTPASGPVVEPEPVGDSGGPDVVKIGEVEAIICQLPWPCAEAIAVAACESGRSLEGFLDGTLAFNMWTATADPFDGVFGLFELALPLHQGVLDLYGGDWRDPWQNAQAAYFLYADDLREHGYGWRQWAWQCQP